MKQKSWCSPYHNNFQTFAEAEIKCTHDPKCKMIYNDGGKNEAFLLCNEGAETRNSPSGSVLYIKRKTV